MKTTEKPILPNRPEFCAEDRCFLPDEELRTVLQRTGMPVFIFDEKGLRACAESLLHCMDPVRPYVSVSACPFPEILRILNGERFGIVCRSPEELQTAISCGFPGERICYAGVCTKPELGVILSELGAEILISSAVRLPEKLPDRVSILCRTQGKRTFHMSSTFCRPRAGLTQEEVMIVAALVKRRGVRELTLAAETEANDSVPGAAAHKATMLRNLAGQIRADCGAEIDRIDLGDVLGMEYRKSKPPVDAAAEFSAAAQALSGVSGEIRAVCGVSRYLIEPNAIFAAACIGAYEREVPTVLINASIRQLSIPQLDRYRHISVLGKYKVAERRTTDVLGIDPLAKDWFAGSRLLPAVEEGDCLILHDVGCCTTVYAECFLVRTDGSLQRLSRRSDCFSATPDGRSDPFPPSPLSD